MAISNPNQQLLSKAPDSTRQSTLSDPNRQPTTSRKFDANISISQNESPATTSTSTSAAPTVAPAWRQFSFYDASPVRDSQDFSKPPSALRDVNQVAAVCSCSIQPLLGAVAGDSNRANDNDDRFSNDDRYKKAKAAARPTVQQAPASARATVPRYISKPCILVGDISGRITLLEPMRYSELTCFTAYTTGRITHISADTKGRIVTLGEEENVKFPILRIWDVRVNAADGNRDSADPGWKPRLLAEGKVQHGSRPHPVAALSHTANLTYLSVGLADGTVLLLRGLSSALDSAPSTMGSTSSASPAVSLPKFKVVFEPTSGNSTNNEPITALGFSQISPAPTPSVTKQNHKSNGEEKVTKISRNLRKTQGRHVTNVKDALQPPIADASTSTASDSLSVSTHLFIVTLSRILRYTVHGKGAGSPPVVVDDVGSNLGCAGVVPSSNCFPSSGPGSAKAPASMSDLTQQQGSLVGKMVVAREEALYVVGVDGREACFAFEGPKSSVRLSSSHLIIVSPPIAATAASTSATVRNFVADRDRDRSRVGAGLGNVSSMLSSASPSGASSPSRASGSSPLSHPAFQSNLNGTSANPNARKVQQGGGTAGKGTHEIAKVTIFDLDNKLVAYSGAFERGVRDAWVGTDGEICVLGDDVNLAKSHARRLGTPEAASRVTILLGDIFQRYGDHLYSKGDFEGAMTQFIKTIGFTPPSYVIRKFLDAQRIKNLTSYLHELHARGLANSDHTTLLLNCYTKLKDVNSLNRFIKRPLALSSEDDRLDETLDPILEDDDYYSSLEGGKTGRDELPFDLETAMRVCRQAGYYSHAAYLARRYHDHDEYIRIQVEDAKDFKDALLYLRSLDPRETELNLVRYGKTLLNELPEKTTDLLIELCAGRFNSTPFESTTLENGETKGRGVDERNPENTQGKSAAAAFLASLQVGGYSKSGTESNSIRSSVAEPYLIDGALERRSSVPAPHLASEGDKSKASTRQIQQDSGFTPPSPTIFFPHFIRHRHQFMRFLTSIAEMKWGQRIRSREEYEKIAPLKKTTDDQQRFQSRISEDPAENEEDEAERVLKRLGLTASDSYQHNGEFDDDSEKRDQMAVWNTLLELYLGGSNSVSSSTNNTSSNSSDRRISIISSTANGALELSRKGQRERALRLLEQHDFLPFDQTHALVLCSMEKFTEGVILLYQQMGMYEEILRYWMDASLDELVGEPGHASTSTKSNNMDSSSSSCKVMETLKLYGEDNPHLYPMTFRYLVSESRILSQHQDDLKSVLNHIEDRGLMSPLEVVQSLSRTGVANVGLVRDYLTRAIEAEREEIDSVSALEDTEQDLCRVCRYSANRSVSGKMKIYCFCCEGSTT